MTVAAIGTIAIIATLGMIATGLLYDRERWRRIAAEQRAENAERHHDVDRVLFRESAAVLRAQHAAELERLNNVWTAQALELRKAKVIPAPADAESRMLELVAKDQAAAVSAAIERGTEKVMEQARAEGRPCTREEAQTVATMMYATAMGGAGIGA